MFTQTVIRALSRLGWDQRGTDPYPRQFSPMPLGKADTMFSSPEWTYEPKGDGFRVLASGRDGAVRLISRNGRSFTNLFGPVPGGVKNVGYGAYATSKQSELAAALEFARETPRIRFNSVEPGFGPGTGLGRHTNALFRFVTKYLLSPLAPHMR